MDTDDQAQRQALSRVRRLLKIVSGENDPTSEPWVDVVQAPDGTGMCLQFVVPVSKGFAFSTMTEEAKKALEDSLCEAATGWLFGAESDLFDGEEAPRITLAN